MILSSPLLRSILWILTRISFIKENQGEATSKKQCISQRIRLSVLPFLGHLSIHPMFRNSTDQVILSAFTQIFFNCIVGELPQVIHPAVSNLLSVSLSCPSSYRTLCKRYSPTFVDLCRSCIARNTHAQSSHACILGSFSSHVGSL